MITNDEAGYELYVTGGLIKEKLTIDEHLKQKWLDDKVRRLNARFQVYVPEVDLVTVVEIRAMTNCGLTYLIFTNVSAINNGLTVTIIRSTHVTVQYYSCIRQFHTI